MKERIRDKGFRKGRRIRIGRIMEILAKEKLGCRGVHYRLVAIGEPNTAKHVKEVERDIRDGRYAGLIDWDQVEDIGRKPWIPYETTEPIADFLRGEIWSYTLPRWRGQRHYVEVWVEKAGMTSLLNPIARAWHVVLLADKGYSSTTEMRRAAP